MADIIRADAGLRYGGERGTPTTGSGPGERGEHVDGEDRPPVRTWFTATPPVT
jgi:hypothetical protein